MHDVIIALQVILMSATIDPYAYTRYFTVKTVPGVKPAPAPAITVQGRTYRVIDFCLDDIKHVGEVSLYKHKLVRSVSGTQLYMYDLYCNYTIYSSCMYFGI